MASGGTVSQIAELRAMARTEDGGKRNLIELKAIDAAYPLYGTAALTPAIGLDAALAKTGGRWGAVVDAALLPRLGLRSGDTIPRRRRRVRDQSRADDASRISAATFWSSGRASWSRSTVLLPPGCSSRAP